MWCKLNQQPVCKQWQQQQDQQQHFVTCDTLQLAGTAAGTIKRLTVLPDGTSLQHKTQNKSCQPGVHCQQEVVLLQCTCPLPCLCKQSKLRQVLADADAACSPAGGRSGMLLSQQTGRSRGLQYTAAPVSCHPESSTGRCCSTPTARRRLVIAILSAVKAASGEKPRPILRGSLAL